MKFSLEPNLFCDGNDCDHIITVTAEDAPTVDGIIREARHHGWRIVLNAGADEDGKDLRCYCPDCAARLSFPLPTTVLEECRAFIGDAEGAFASQKGVNDLLTRIDQCLGTGDTPTPLYVMPGHCPYCLTKMHPAIVPNTGGNIHYACCPKCSAHGPWAKSKAEALSK